MKNCWSTASDVGRALRRRGYEFFQEDLIEALRGMVADREIVSKRLAGYTLYALPEEDLHEAHVHGQDVVGATGGRNKKGDGPFSWCPSSPECGA